MSVVFDKLVPVDLRPLSTAILQDGAFRISLANEVQVHIRAFTAAERRPPDLYECFLVRPVHKGQNQFISLSQRGSNLRLGYLFPLASFADDSDLEDWAGKYARVGVEALLNSDLARDHLTVMKIDDVIHPDGVSITEIFDPDLGLVIVGKENLNNAQCTIDMIRMMIQEHGVRILSTSSLTTAPDEPAEFTDHFTIRQYSPHLRDDLSRFCYLLEVAEQQQYLPARFLILYQIIEALISRLYEHAVRALVSDPVLLKNVWELREEFEKISSEKSRINKLFGEYLNPKPPEFHGLTEQLKLACLAFLHKADPTVTPVPLVPISAHSTDISPIPQPVPNPSHPAVVLEADVQTTSPPLPLPTVASQTISDLVPPSTTAAVQATVAASAASAATLDLSQRGWPEILYRCRNLIVHRQWQITAIPEVELGDVCDTLERVYFVALNCFVAQPE